MKKTITLLLVLALSLGLLTACGSTEIHSYQEDAQTEDVFANAYGAYAPDTLVATADGTPVYWNEFSYWLAHSVECWRREAESFDSNDVRRNLLVGGVYGTAVNGFFEGESMFSVERDASKVALFSLFERLRQNGFALFDAQVLNPHTQSLGGIEIPRYEYLLRLRDATSKRATF